MRKFFVWLHRWVGLSMAVFLVIVGLSGSLLAFNTDLEKLASPQLFAAKPYPDARQLDLATLAERAEAEEPHIRVGYFSVGPEQAFMHVLPRRNPATGKPYAVDFDQMFLDPWTGRKLGHRRAGDLSQGMINLMPFVYRLHMNLALGEWGAWVLGFVAFAWTLDCFYAVYLTFPASFSRFFSRWKIAWKIKRPSSAYRLNYDLHRASGLWLAPMLFIFAWSSVMFNLSPVYEWTTAALFDMPSVQEEMKTLHPSHPSKTPRLNWHEGLQKSESAMREIAGKEGFSLGQPYGFAYIPNPGVYSYSVESSRNITVGNWEGMGVWVDGETGELQKVFHPTGEHSGITLSNWLRALHFANLYGWLAYRVAVCVLGIAIAVLSVTGFVIWFKKRQARKFSEMKRARLTKEAHA